MIPKQEVEMSERKETCANCKAWKSEDGRCGECRRHAPDIGDATVTPTPQHWYWCLEHVPLDAAIAAQSEEQPAKKQGPTREQQGFGLQRISDHLRAEGLHSSADEIDAAIRHLRSQRVAGKQLAAQWALELAQGISGMGTTAELCFWDTVVKLVGSTDHNTAGEMLERLAVEPDDALKLGSDKSFALSLHTKLRAAKERIAELEADNAALRKRLEIEERKNSFEPDCD